MYSGSNKHRRGGGSSRGGGGSASKRNSFPPPPPHRNRPSPSSSRLSLGGSRSRTPTSSAPPTPQSSDESFRLVGGAEPLPFAAIIKLPPDLVDEIKRIEGQGGAARIKFDSSSSNPGNVIDVGDKEFRFTWVDESRSCDIYEERQSGEDGDGLLVESGLMWRKLNIQRVLDESTKKQVKMRSLECEQTLKSRKAIVLEPGNPSMKNQMKALAAAEASPWKHKQRKDFHFKKKNNEPQQFGGPPKTVHRSAISSSSSAKRTHSVSPLPSPQNQSLPAASPSARGPAAESQTIIENLTPTLARSKEIADCSAMDISPRVTGKISEGAVHQDNQGAGLSDVQHLLITLLKENPKGMSIKALEKAVGDATSNSVCKIDAIVKKIANCEPSGRYVLKLGVESEKLKSSLEDNHQTHFESENICARAPDLDSGLAKEPPYDGIKQVTLNNKFERDSNLVENLDPARHLTDLFGDEPLDHNGGRAASSSGSDSDSGSSNSGSDSASRNRRSKSPVASASSSDSDSSKSKESSDVEVDIMSSDDKEQAILPGARHGLSATANPWSMPEARPLQNGNLVDQDGYASEDVDIENNFLGGNEAHLRTASHDLGALTENVISVSHDQNQPFSLTGLVNEHNDTEDILKHRHVHNKRASGVLHSVEKSNNVKRSKGSGATVSISGRMGSHSLNSPPVSSPDIPNVDQLDNRQFHLSSKTSRINSNRNVGTERGNDNLVPGKSSLDSLQPGQRPSRSHIPEMTDRPVKNHLHFGLGANYQEMSAHSRENILKQGEKGFGNMQDEEGNSNEKGNGKYYSSPLGQKSSMLSASVYKKHSERSKNSHALDTSSKSHPELSPKDNIKADIDRSAVDRKMLQRELSDLELGELREPLPEEPELSRREFDRVGSFKKSEAKLSTSSSRKADLKGISACQTKSNAGNASSPNLRGIGRKTDSSTKLRSPEASGEEAFQPQRGLLSEQQHSRSSHTDFAVSSDKAVEINSLEVGESFDKQGVDIDSLEEERRKLLVDAPHNDSIHECMPRKGKGSKSRKSKSVGDGADKRKDASVLEGRSSKRKRNNFSSNDDTLYYIYEKEEPDLKEPIKTFSEYQAYVQEYREKYEHYCSLNKILENYRNEFQTLGMDLENAKGERYNTILAQLRDNYRQCGPRHKRLKKIFIVLHEELKHLKQRVKDFAVQYTRG